MARALCCIAFSRTAIFHPARHDPSSIQRRFATTTTANTDLSSPTTGGDSADLNNFNPLGPPSFLACLPVGEIFHLPSHDKNITRLSSSPDIFLVRDFLSTEDGETLMQSAVLTGMKQAGTKNSKADTIRKNSRLTWIDPNQGGIDHTEEAASVAKRTIAKSMMFSHEIMNDQLQAERMEYALAEDVQVAKYDVGGRFDNHHDGYGRYLTVLTYLNGVGGTYFPFGNNDSNENDFTNQSKEQAMATIQDSVEKCGILIVGKEGANPYLDTRASSSTMNPKTVVEIRMGDAIAFYNYAPDGERDLRSLHCGLSVPEEKWIATCWFQSEALTGPFGYLKRGRLLEDMDGGNDKSIGGNGILGI